ncbi:MAG: hypothetical protein LBE56_03165, partial [Tannerella sp.]|nr:hypothetical protein [Tannerella sp.]
YNAQQQAGGGQGNPQGHPFDNFQGGNPFAGGGAPGNGGNANPNKPNDGGVTDVDFEEVK